MCSGVGIEQFMAVISSLCVADGIWINYNVGALILLLHPVCVWMERSVFIYLLIPIVGMVVNYVAEGRSRTRCLLCLNNSTKIK